MRVPHLAAGFVACAALALAGEVRAGDDIRPSMPVGAEAPTLDLTNLDADAQFVQYRYRGGYGGYRGYYGGYRGYYGGYRGYYGGYRNYYGGYPGYYGGYRNYYGGYPGFYGGYGNYSYGGGYQPYYYPGYYYSPGVSFGFSFGSPYDYYGPSYCPMGLEIGTQPAPQVLNVRPPQSEYSPPARREDGTYPYDGGPQNPVPMPGAEPAAPKAPPATLPPAGRIVSLKEKPTKYSYAAYGEDAPSSKPSRDRMILVGAKKTGR